MPNPRAQRPLSLQAVTEDIRSLAQPAQAMLDMLAGAAKGSVSATVGIPGDIESLGRGIASAFRAPSGQRLDAFATGMEQPTVLPTTENVSAKLPAVVPTTAPLSRQHSAEYGQTAGEFIPTPGSGRAIKGGLSMAGQALNDRLLAGQSLTPLINTPAPITHVVKPKGGNWLSGNVEKQVGRMKMADTIPTEKLAENQQAIDTAKRIMGDDPTAQRAIQQMEHEMAVNKRNNAINNWIDRNLTNYIKKEMATPEDPVRKLAEEGILHIKPFGDQYQVSQRLMNKRMGAGFNPLGEGKSEPARFWERQADISIDPYPAGSYKHGALDEGLLEANPWLNNVPDEEIISYGKGLNDLGFDHIIDVLRQDVREGRIRPEQLSKVSMEQAVRRAYEYDQEMAKKMAEAQIKATEGMPVHKEYPEGYRWIELGPGKELPEGWTTKNGAYYDPKGERHVHPDSEKVANALKYEGETMGHCVGGYCPDVLEGRSRIYSLRDAKGEPHVTVEVQPQRNPYLGHSGNITDKGLQLIRQKFPESNFDTEYGDWFRKSGGHSMHFAEGYAPWLKQNHPEIYESTIGAPMGQNIVQIKGKQNRAPKEEYLPYVQDFVRGGEWSDVGDLQNTGLRRIKEGSDIPGFEEWMRLKALGNVPTIPPGYYTPQELLQFGEQSGLKETHPSVHNVWMKKLGLNPDEGMKRGGKVSISDNPDTMMIELGEQKFGIGGLTKAGRLARAPAKSKEEIRAVAERMAPQVTGEFVRGEKGTQSVAGKTQKQFAREKELKHDIRGDMPPPGTIDYEKLKDQVVIGIPGDPTITGKSLYSVGETPLESPSPQHGGPLYGLGKEGDSFWASQLGAAKRVQNLAREAGEQYEQPVLGQYIMMGPDSINYAQHFADANLSAIDVTKMSKKQIEGFNKLLREGSAKSGPRYSFPGIENKEDAYLYMAVDPELRKHFNALMQMPTITEKFNLPSGIDVRHAVTEPALRDLETGVTGYSVGKMRPEIEDLKLSIHPTYSHDIPGEFLGQSRHPIPYEIMFPDTLKAVRENPKQAPQEFGSLKMIGPRQTIDQQMIDEIRMYEEMMKGLTGKKKGGVIKKAAGGEITADDLTIEERPL